MKLKSSTIFEATVAVSVIALVIGISTLIYGNLMNSQEPLTTYKAKDEIKGIFQETKSSKAFFNKTFSYETFDIEQQVDFYKGNKRLYQINYQVTSNGKQIWKESHLVANTQYVES